MIGSTLGSYEIKELVGSGGMASVYRAYQPNVDRDVAIKVILQTLDRDTEAIQRFQREARLIARLEHPHLLPIYDFDGGHEPPYIVMRFLDGGTLKDLLAQSDFQLNEVSKLFRQICAALDYAHRQGIVHRDIKPSNILVDREGNAFVTDFGIARMVGRTPTDFGITGAGAVIGTPDYMAPEQIMGRDVDRRVDIYALGIVLFEMVTGQLPYQTDNPARLLYLHLEEPIPSAAVINESLPIEIDEVFARALAKNRQDRFESAAIFADVVASVLDGSSARTRTITPDYESGAPVTIRRRPLTPSLRHSVEHHRIVTALYANAAEYPSLIDSILGSAAVRMKMNQLWQMSTELIESFGGFVLSLTADTLLALWGVDTSQEDDAERAVRAALAIHNNLSSQISDLTASEYDDTSLPIDIGINTGLALLASSGDIGEITTTGATTSIANQLSRHAEGIILISHNTYNHIRGVFDVEPHSWLKIRYQDRQLQTYRVDRSKGRAFRMFTRGIEGIETQMIGREAELLVLKNAYLDAVEDQETQVITVVSDAGLGKSRLLYEFDHWAELHPETFWIFRARPSAEMRHQPFAILRELLIFRFELLDSDSPQMVRSKLVEGIGEQVGPDDEMVDLLGQLAGFDFSKSPWVKDFLDNPQQLIDRGKQLFIKWITALCSQNPVVIELDDIHNADEASLDLIMELAEKAQDLSLLIIGLARPALYERRPNWFSGISYHSRVDLRPLDKRGSRSLVREVLKQVDSIPKVLRDLLVERSEGNPYYLEELVKMLIDERVIIKEKEDFWRVEKERLGYLPVPGTLNGLLQARMDSLLLPERVTLERATILGPVFYDSALETLDRNDDFHVEDAPAILRSLASREDIYRREVTSFAGSNEFIFRSNLLRDIVYDSLSTARREDYHRIIANWYEEVSGDRVEEFSARIAEHLDRAGDDIGASNWYMRAASRAVAQGALVDARRYYEWLLLAVPESETNRRWQVLIGLDEVLGTLGEIEAKKAISERLIPFAQAIDDNYLAEAYLRHGYTFQMAADDAEALTNYQLGLESARRAGNLEFEADGLGQIVVVYTRMGELNKSEPLAQKAYALTNRLSENVSLARTLNNISLYYVAKGDHSKAAEILEKQAAICRNLGQRIGEAYASLNLGYNYLLLGLYQQGRVALQRSLELAELTGSRPQSAYNRLNLALADIYLEDLDSAKRMLMEATEILEEIGDAYGSAISGSYMGLLLEKSEVYDAASIAFEDSVAELSKIGASGSVLDAKSGQARCAQALNDSETALNLAKEVWEILVEQGSHGAEFPILAYLTCAQIYMEQGKESELRRILKHGHSELTDRAEKISDPEWRQSFLDNVPEHRLLINLWEEHAG